MAVLFVSIVIGLLAVANVFHFNLVGDRALKPVHDLANWFDKTFDAKRENGKLITKVRAIRRQAVAGKVAQAENGELRPLLRFDKSGVLPLGRLVTGMVIVRSLENPYSFLTINRGARDCVKAGDLALNGHGLVGKVDTVSQRTAKILLLTNPKSAVSAKVESSHVRGLVIPDVGEPGRLILEFISENKSLHAGQEILTSAWHRGAISSSFPANIPIGRITKLSLSRLEATGTTPVKPYIDVNNLELVQILTAC